jgi:hypothetical protein
VAFELIEDEKTVWREARREHDVVDVRVTDQCRFPAMLGPEPKRLDLVAQGNIRGDLGERAPTRRVGGDPS